MTRKTGFLAFYLVLLAVGLIATVYLYPHTHFAGGMRLSLDERQSEDRAESFLQAAGHRMDGFYTSTRIEKMRSVNIISERRLGIRKSNAAVRDSLPVYTRTFRWYVDPPAKLPGIFFPHDRTQAPGGPLLRMTGSGDITHFSIEPADTVPRAPLAESEAAAYAKHILGTFTRFSHETLGLKSMERDEAEGQTNWHFTWQWDDPVIGYPVMVEIHLTGDRLTLLRERYDLPEHLLAERKELIRQLTTSLFYFAITAFLLILAVGRLRAGELGFRNAIVVSIFSFAAFCLQLWLMHYLEFEWVLLVLMVINGSVVASMVLVGWAVSESMGRQSWREKFISADLLAHGYLMNSAVGRAMVRGAAFGVVLYALYGVLLYSADGVSIVWYLLPTDFLNYINSPIAAGYAIVYGLFNAIFLGALFFVSIGSKIRQHTNSSWLIVGVPAVLYGAAHMWFIQPSLAGFVSVAATGAIIAMIFYRCDVLTLLMTLTIYISLEMGMVLFFAGDPVLLQQGFIFAAVLGCVVTIGCISLLTRDADPESSFIEPVFQRYISERERLQREFEIAREVQKGFLPRETPAREGLDIAARCIPAREIGGDYFDFIMQDEKHTGIVIGDVSGKGTKAAFYMTLAKGLIHSAAENECSPAATLSKINRLFYRHTDRGAFISMVYAIHTPETNTLTIARAGHNPIVYYDSATGKAEFIQPGGIAIGLHHDTKFDETIHDSAIRVRPGDLFVFYTDGITEAMNTNREEFGTDRLFETIREYRDCSASVLLEHIFRKVGVFTRRTDQSDDMTMVIIRIE
jgi:serine phosphatase RsbU (regulator of sigma subunit)